MNRSTQKRIRFFAPESAYTSTTAAGSFLKERLKQRVYYKLNHTTKKPALSSSPSVVSSFPPPILTAISKNQEQQQHQQQHQQHPTPNVVTTIPCNLTYSDVCVGELLGSGAFASVYNISFQTKNKRQKALSSPCRLQFENSGDQDQHQQHQSQQRQPPEVRGIQDRDDVPNTDNQRSQDDTHHSLNENLHHLNKHSHHHLQKHHHNDDQNNTQPAYYALKCLQQDKLLTQQGSKYSSKAAKIAIHDFLMECNILSKIQQRGDGGGGGGHPNIIRLVGISNNFADDPSRGFLVLEKVSETLQQALVRWRAGNCPRAGENHIGSSTHNSMSISPAFHPRRNKNKRRLQREQGERVRLAGLGVARALQFLHKHRIIYRGKHYTVVL
jgi:hypothetical protein